MLLQHALDLSFSWPATNPGLLCGFDKIDLYFGGLQRGQVHLIYGPEGIGVSSLMLNMALQVGRHAGVLHISADDPKLIAREVLCSYASFDRDRLDRGLIRRKELSATRETMGRWLRHPVIIEQSQMLSPQDVLHCLSARVDDSRKMVDGIGLVVIDLGQHAYAWDDESFAMLRQLAQLHSLAILVHIGLPASRLPAEVIDDGMQSMPGAMWLVPNITAFDGRMPELPHSSLGDVVMLMHWTLDHKTGAAYPERRIMQVVRLHYRFQLGISLWHDPSTGAYEEDETGLCWGSFPKHCDTCDWVTGEDIWDYDLD